MGKFYTKEERDEFYKSDSWKEIKENLFKLRQRQCEVCDTKRYMKNL